MSSSQATLRHKRKQWLEALLKKDRNSVIIQIARMMEDALAFRIVFEARGLTPRDHKDKMKLNTLMHGLLDRCFFNDQMVAIRRLADSYSLEDEKRGVYSLMSVLEDMQTHCDLFKRKAMFDAEDREYDIDLVRRKEQAYERKQHLAGKTVFGTPTDLDPVPIAERHRDIDKLAGVRAEDRRPDDNIPEAVFTALKGKLDDVTKKIRLYVDKFLAHAATPRSRALQNADEVSITLDHITEAHRAICCMTSLLAGAVLGHSQLQYLVPGAYGDVLKYIDRPLVTASDVDQLKDIWQELYKDWSTWGDWTKSDLLQELRGQSED